MKIYCILNPAPTEKEYLIDKTKPDEIVFHHEQVSTSAEKAFRECEIVFGNPPLEWLENVPNLKWVQLSSAGLDPYQNIIKEGEIKFSNLKGFYDAPVTETAIGGLLMLLRKLHVLHRAQEGNRWIKSQVRTETETLIGKKVFILGMGSLGKNVKRCLRPFGPQFLGDDHFPRNTDADTVKQVEENIQKCDVLIACLPELPQTIHFLNAARLGFLHSNAIVVNVGRGSLIDEVALVHLLEINMIAGAFLDVTEQEPIPENSSLWKVPNVILNQHTGGSSKDEVIMQVRFIAKNYLAFKKDSAKNVVQP